MNSKEIKNLIQNGEKIDVEFKESKTQWKNLGQVL